MKKRREFIELYELVENTGFLFNPVITYSGSFLLRTGSLTANSMYDSNKDIFMI